MKKKYSPIIIFILFLSSAASAQKADFINSGKIEFEKKVNVFALMKELTKDDQSSWVEEYQDRLKKNISQFYTTYQNLYFSGQKATYVTGKENPENDKMNMWGIDKNEVDNIVYSDYGTQQTIKKKHIFEDNFLITDSCRKINWKITNETREIAGITCRRANAVILDSVYVVAFYTDQIITPGGPESFSGLPGMILGVALPYDHVTWFATTVSKDENAESHIVPPTKGKKVDYKGLNAELQPTLKNWGTQGKMILKNAIL